MALFNLAQLVTPENANGFGMVVNSVSIYSGEDFYTLVRTRYNHMLFETPETDIENAKTDLKKVYDMWVRLNGEDFLRIYNAMRSEYSPLENYDRLEEGSTETAHHKGTRTSQATDVTVTPTTKTRTSEAINITETPTATTNRAEKVNAFDGGSVDNTQTVEQMSGSTKREGSAETNYSETEFISGNTKTEGTAEGNYTETRDISDTVYDKDVETFNGRRTHGNIGVVTTQTLITEEINLRLLGFIETIISQFIEKFTFYVSGV